MRHRLDDDVGIEESLRVWGAMILACVLINLVWIQFQYL